MSQKFPYTRRRNNAQRKILRCPEISASLRGVTLLLISLLNHKSQYRVAWPSAQLLADKLGMSRRNVQRHLKVVRALGFFSVHYLKPKDARDFLADRYGIKADFSKCRKQAPPIYEINGHELWTGSKDLSKAGRQEIECVIRATRNFRSKPTNHARNNDIGVTTGTVPGMSEVMTRLSSSSNDTDVTQLGEKEIASSEPFPFSPTLATPLEFFQNKGVTEGHPDRVYAITNHLPTQPPSETTAIIGAFQKGKEEGSAAKFYRPTSGPKGVNSQANSSPPQDIVLEPGVVDLAVLMPEMDKKSITKSLKDAASYSDPISVTNSKESKGEPFETFQPAPPQVMIWEEPEERDAPPVYLKCLPLSEQLFLFRVEKETLSLLEKEFSFPAFPIIPKTHVEFFSKRFQAWLDRIEPDSSPQVQYASMMRTENENQSHELICDRLFRDTDTLDSPDPCSGIENNTLITKNKTSPVPKYTTYLKIPSTKMILRNYRPKGR